MTIQEWAQAKIGTYESAGFPHLGKVLSYQLTLLDDVKGTYDRWVEFTCENKSAESAGFEPTIVARKKFFKKFEKIDAETFKEELHAHTQYLDEAWKE